MKESKTGYVRKSVRSLLVCRILLSSATVLFGLNGCSSGHDLTPIKTIATPVVEVARPEFHTVVRTVELPGTIEAYQQANLYAKVAGYLRTISVDIGDHVKAGQLLATIDAPEMQQKAAQAEEIAKGASALAAGKTAMQSRALNEEQQTEAEVAKAQAKLASAQTGAPRAIAERDAAASEVQLAVEQERQSKVSVSRAQSDVAQAQSSSELNQQTYHRLKQIYDRDNGLLARQDLDIARTKMIQSESKVTAAEQSVEMAREGVSVATQVVAAAQSSLAAMKQGVMSARSQARVALQQIKVAQAQARSARSQMSVVAAQERSVVNQSQAERQAAHSAATMFNYTLIRAPFAGTITKRFLDPGALVQSADKSSQGTTKPLLTIVNTNTVRIFVQVAETDAPFVHVGTQATIRVDALPASVFRARVTRTADSLDTSTRTMLTEIDMPNHRNLLQSGMLVKVTLDLEAHHDVLTAPTSAIIFEKGKGSVFVVEGGKAKKVSVRTGYEGTQWVELVSGLTRNEPIIVTGKENVSNGEAVQVKSLP